MAVFIVLYTVARMKLFKLKPDLHHEDIERYSKDLKDYTILRERASGVERERYDYIIEVMQRTLTVLIDTAE